MIPLTQKKVVMVTAPTALVDDAAVTTSTIDTAGYDYATIVCYVGTTDIAMTALKVQESDASNMGSAVDIDATDFSDATQKDIDGNALALPAADADGTFRIIGIDLRTRKRYLDLVANAGNGTSGTWFYAFAILERAKVSPSTNVAIAGTGGIVVAA